MASVASKSAIISLFIGHIIEFTVIIIIIFLIVLLSFFMEYRASKDMDALIKLTPKKSFVIRNKEEKEISSKELTIGDIIVLRRGGVVGADAVLIESNSLKLDESTLTGESVSVNKFPGQLTGTVDLANRTNMVFSGTNITDGFGLAVVVHIGMQTEIGKTTRETSARLFRLQKSGYVKKTEVGWELTVLGEVLAKHLRSMKRTELVLR